MDLAVPQTTMDKMEAWKQYHFDAMFVGDDWKGSDLWKERERVFKEVGVDIVYFPYTKSTSSTQLRDVLLKIQSDHIER